MLKQIYIPKKSFVHNIDLWTKLVSLLIIFPLIAFLAKPQILLLVIIIFGFLLLFSKVGLKVFWQQARNYLIPISIGLLVLSLIFTPGSLFIKIIAALELSMRFAIFISFGLFFSMVTNPIEFPAGFLRVKIPHRYGVTLMVAYRMMPLLSKKIATIMEAQKARGASFKFSVPKIDRFFLQISSLMVPLLHSTLEMSVRLSDALISRGYNPNGKITVPSKKWSFFDFSLILISLLLLLITILI